MSVLAIATTLFAPRMPLRFAPRCSPAARASSSSLPFPRGAVSCILRLAAEPPRYLLVQRGRPPNKGAWSLPGGKLNLGEPALAGVVREVGEETHLPPSALSVHPRPISATDSIVPDSEPGTFLFHYCIVQCFAWVDPSFVDHVMPGDDAADAKWFTADQMRELPGPMAADMFDIVEVSEGMAAAGLIAPPQWKTDG